MTKIEFNLPDGLVEDAEAAGLLDPKAIEALLRAELRASRLRAFDAIRTKLKEDPIPEMSMEEIQAEVDAVRKERRARRS